jgi:hypothetical protein
LTSLEELCFMELDISGTCKWNVGKNRDAAFPTSLSKNQTLPIQLVVSHYCTLLLSDYIHSC